MATPTKKISSKDNESQKKQFAQFVGFAVNFCTVFSLIFVMVLLLIINITNTGSSVANTSESLCQLCSKVNAVKANDVVTPQSSLPVPVETNTAITSDPTETVTESAITNAPMDLSTPKPESQPADN